jgi:hypothetical protein
MPFVGFCMFLGEQSGGGGVSRGEIRGPKKDLFHEKGLNPIALGPNIGQPTEF